MNNKLNRREEGCVTTMTKDQFAAVLTTLGATEAEIDGLWDILDVEGFGGSENEAGAVSVLMNKLDWYRTVRC
jgi:hypothetical protein